MSRHRRGVSLTAPRGAPGRLDARFLQKRFGAHDVAIQSQVGGVESHGEAEELRDVENGDIELALDHLGGVELLRVKV